MDLYQSFGLAVLGCSLMACGSETEQSSTEPAAETRAPVATPDDYAMPRNFAGMDLCAVVSGEAVAAATNTKLVTSEPNLDPVWCTYTVSGDEPYEKRITIHVDGNGMLFTVGRQTASTAEPVTGLGVDGWAKTVGGEREVNIKRDDDVYINVIAWNQEAALAGARLALDSVPR